MNDKSYKCETVMDFTKVPEDRIDACLEEFKDFIGHMRHISYTHMTLPTKA